MHTRKGGDLPGQTDQYRVGEELFLTEFMAANCTRRLYRPKHFVRTVTVPAGRRRDSLVGQRHKNKRTALSLVSDTMS